MDVGIFGGSFNPPHLAHLIVAEAVCEQFHLGTVLWIPAFRPPHKASDTLASYEHRLCMTRLATADNPRFEVSDLERSLGGVSYTIDTVTALQAAAADRVYHLILGEDSYNQFSSWRRPQELLERVRLIVYRRFGDAPSLEPIADPTRVSFARAPRIELAAADIRARRRRGESIRYLVSEPVRRYIREHNLYAS